MEIHLIVKRVMATVTPDTPVRMNVKQLIAIAVFFVTNTAIVCLYFDRRMSANEHATERQGDRISIVEGAQQKLSTEVAESIDKQNAKLDRLTDAINSLAVNVAKLGARTP
jgi:hypothetical protein